MSDKIYPAKLSLSGESFAARVREARTLRGLSQKELAERAKVALRTIQNWEGGVRRPSQFEAVSKLAGALGVTTGELLDRSDELVLGAAERGGSAAAREIDELVSACCGLFAGGELDEEEKDGIMAALNEAYWIAKRNNAKYGAKKRAEAKE